MTKIDERCRAMTLNLEWSLNRGDCQGQRCPMCETPRGVVGDDGAAQGRHEDDCRLGRLCDDLRAIERARALEEAVP